MKLSNFAIGQKLLIVVLTPTLLTLALASVIGLERFRTYQLNQQTLLLVELSKLLDNIAHEHAVERGLTAGFLGSNGRLGLDKVQAQRARADAAEQALLAFNAGSTEQLRRLGVNIGKILAQLERKSDTRQLVERFDPAANAFQLKLKSPALMVQRNKIVEHSLNNSRKQPLLSLASSK